MNHSMVAKITTNGQISLPAPVRRRWKAAQVVLEDLGDRMIVRPLPDDPIAAACGSLPEEVRRPTGPGKQSAAPVKPEKADSNEGGSHD